MSGSSSMRYVVWPSCSGGSTVTLSQSRWSRLARSSGAAWALLGRAAVVGSAAEATGSTVTGTESAASVAAPRVARRRSDAAGLGVRFIVVPLSERWKFPGAGQVELRSVGAQGHALVQDGH